MLDSQGGVRVFELFGTPVRFHPNFLFLVLIVALNWLDEGLGAIFIVVFAIAASVLVHEFGHVLALKFNGEPSDVTIWAFGGFTRHSGRLSGPADIVVSLVGPFAGLLFWAVAWFGFMPAPAREAGYASDPSQIFAPINAYVVAALDGRSLGELLWYQLCWMNLFWSLINLVPVLPLDGGHVLLKSLALRMRLMRATRITATVGVAAALAMAAFGYLELGEPFIVVFFLLMAWQNWEALKAR